MAADIGRVAVQARNERGQVHCRRDEHRSRLAASAQVEPWVKVHVQSALDVLGSRAQHRGDAKREGVQRGRQHQDARAEHGHVTGQCSN